MLFLFLETMFHGQSFSSRVGTRAGGGEGVCRRVFRKHESHTCYPAHSVIDVVGWTLLMVCRRVLRNMSCCMVQGGLVSVAE